MRRFGDCVRDFADDDGLKGEFVCEPVWGEEPSAELRLPAELLRSKMAAAGPTRLAAIGASAPVSAAGPEMAGDVAARDMWYGFYPNGREVVIAVEAVHGRI